MDPLGLKDALDNLPAEARPIIQILMDRVDTLEARAAQDANLIVDKVLGVLSPKIDAAIATVNSGVAKVSACADRFMSLIGRADGASVTLKLAPAGQ